MSPNTSGPQDRAPQAAGPDVRQLQDETLPTLGFPGGHGQQFRVYFDPQVHREIWQHALADTSVEICGVLVGRWHGDADGPFVLVSGSIRGQAAANKFAEVTFTHETWAAINTEMDSKFADQAIVGWYHTHPDFGIFLSDRDRFIQENFFSGAGQIALVVDPIRQTEGVFVWRDGKTQLAEHFWVGGGLKVAPDNARPAAESRSAGAAPAAEQSPTTGAAAPPSWSATIQSVLMSILVFLLGYLLAARISDATLERARAEGAAFALVQIGLRPDLESRLDELRTDLQGVAAASSALWNSQANLLAKAEGRAEELEQARAVRGEAEQRMNHMLRVIDLTQRQNCMNPREREIFEQFLLARQQANAAAAKKDGQEERAPAETKGKDSGAAGKQAGGDPARKKPAPAKAAPGSDPAEKAELNKPAATKPAAHRPADEKSAPPPAEKKAQNIPSSPTQ